jgi:hypothetical protein
MDGIMFERKKVWGTTPVAALPQDVKTAWAVLFKLIEDGKIEKDASPDIMLEILKLAHQRVASAYLSRSQLYMN